MKKIVVFSLSLLSLPIFGMKPEVKVDENMHTVEEFKLNMGASCQKECSLFKDISQRCTSNCYKNYSKQYSDSLTRKYTNRCAGLPSDEKWSYKTDNKDREKDLAETSKALSKWENPAINQCARAHLIEFKRIIESANRITDNKDRTFAKEHPVRLNFFQLKDKIRRLDPPKK